MTMKRVSKEALIGDTLLFNSETDDQIDRIHHSFAMNHIDIISLDALDDGNPVTPTTGTYEIYAKTDIDGGFKLVPERGSFLATLTGGSGLPDGVAVGASFTGFPIEFKIVPTGVDVAVAYRVDIKQSSVQLSKIPDDFVASFETIPSLTALNVFVKNFTTTAFGDLRVESLAPITQLSAEYGLLTQTLTVTDSEASGSNSIVDNKFTSQTGTAADGLASILSLRQLKYRAGQGALARLTSVFSPGVADSQQAAGLITAENAFAFGFLGESFGITHAHDGKSEAQELTITTPASGSENATITVDGTGFTVPLTAGTAQHNAFEISNSLNAQVPNYDFTSNNDQVVAQGELPGPAASFAFSSATAVGAWDQTVAGVVLTIDFTPQSAWNVDTRLLGDEPLDPLVGNVYQIQFQYLGFGAIKFYIEDKDSGDFMLVHVIRYANTNTSPSVTNPTFRIGWIVRNLGNTSNLTIQGSSAGAFIEGMVKRNTPPLSDDNTQLSVGLTLTNIIAFRNRLHFGDKANRAEIFPLLATAATDAVKPAVFEIIANPIFGGDVDWSYFNKDNSVMEIATDSVPVSGGQSIGTLIVAAGPSQTIEFNTRPNLDFVALAGNFFSIAARITSGAAAAMTASGTWQDDL